MNKTFKVVFNHNTGTFQAVQETAKGKHKTTSSQKNNKAVSVLKAMVRPVVMMMGVLSSAVAVAMPTGGQVSVGQATIN